MTIAIKTLAPAGPSINEAFNERVLHGLSWCDVVPINLAILLPFEDGVAGQFGAVVADDQIGIAPHLSNAI